MGFRFLTILLLLTAILLELQDPSTSFIRTGAHDGFETTVDVDSHSCLLSASKLQVHTRAILTVEFQLISPLLSATIIPDNAKQAYLPFDVAKVLTYHLGSS